MNWNTVKQHFEDHGALVDIYYEGMTNDGWLKLFSWLRANENLESVYCYLPEQDKNLDYFPESIATNINQNGFYCFVSLLVDGVTIFFRFYEKSELECDIPPIEIDCEAKLNVLLEILANVQKLVDSSRYVICPENFKEGTFNINGVFIS